MDCPYCKVPLMNGMTSCPKCKWDIYSEDGGPNHILWLNENSPEALARKKAEKEEVERRTRAEAEKLEKLEFAKSLEEKAEFVSQKIEKLKAEGRDGYYEYKVAQIPLRGDITPVQATIDSFSLNGWKIDSYNPSASGGSVMILFSKYNKF